MDLLVERWQTFRLWVRIQRATWPLLFQWSFYPGIPIAACWIIIFGVVWRSRNFNDAVEIALGTKGPFGGSLSWVAVTLAAMSLLLIPAIVGGVAGVAIAEQLKRGGGRGVADLAAELGISANEVRTRLNLPSEVGDPG